MRLLIRPFSEESLGDILRRELESQTGDYDTFYAAVAYLKTSGLSYIREPLQAFIQNGGKARIVAGIDQFGTSYEALQTLLSISGNCELWVNHDTRKYITYHPKLYLFEGQEKSLLIVSSGNITEGGLFMNDEATSVNILLPDNPSDVEALNAAKSAFKQWCKSDEANIRRLDPGLLESLHSTGYIKTEEETRILESLRVQNESGAAGSKQREHGSTPLFGPGSYLRRSPPRPRPQPDRSQPNSASTHVDFETYLGFVMILTRTDVGVGQTTSGTSRRSPEVFIPLAARDAYPEFWGWDEEFVTEKTDRGNEVDKRSGVKARLAAETIEINMWCWRNKSDFRLRSEKLRSAGQEGDILRMERIPSSSDFEYYVEIVPMGTSLYQYYMGFCDKDVPNSRKKWGYYRID